MAVLSASQGDRQGARVRSGRLFGVRRHLALRVLAGALGFAAGTRSAGAEDGPAPAFQLGAWVGADPFAWNDLHGMGDDSAATIDAICADLAAAGCNSVWVAGFSPFFAERPLIGVWLDAAERHGLRAVIEGSGTPFAIPKDDPAMAAIEWEYGTGMRTLDGRPTASHRGLVAVGRELKPALALLGRMRPEGEAIEVDEVLGRLFRDPEEGADYVVLVNRDLKQARRVPQELQRKLEMVCDESLEPGDGRLIRRR